MWNLLFRPRPNTAQFLFEAGADEEAFRSEVSMQAIRQGLTPCLAFCDYVWMRVRNLHEAPIIFSRRGIVHAEILPFTDQRDVEADCQRKPRATSSEEAVAQ